RALIVEAAKSRARCCRSHPVSIAVNTASCGGGGTTPSPSTRCAAPATKTRFTHTHHLASDATCSHQTRDAVRRTQETAGRQPPRPHTTNSAYDAPKGE